MIWPLLTISFNITLAMESLYNIIDIPNLHLDWIDSHTWQLCLEVLPHEPKSDSLWLSLICFYTPFLVFLIAIIPQEFSSQAGQYTFLHLLIYAVFFDFLLISNIHRSRENSVTNLHLPRTSFNNNQHMTISASMWHSGFLHLLVIMFVL